MPAKISVVFLCQENGLSLSFSGLRGWSAPKPLGVPIGVVSAVDERPASLAIGEKCKGGGVSRESSFTVNECLMLICGRDGALDPRADQMGIEVPVLGGWEFDLMRCD